MSLFLKNTLQTYASQLNDLPQVPGRQNFLFGPSIEDSDVLLKAIRNAAADIVLMLEYSDSSADFANQTQKYALETLEVGLSVIGRVSLRQDPTTETAQIIYNVCKPLLQQVIARLQTQSETHLLNDGCHRVQLLKSYTGNWVGPVANDYYGYRYTLQFRIFNNAFAYDPDKWSL